MLDDRASDCDRRICVCDRMPAATLDRTTSASLSPVGLHRVLEPTGERSPCRRRPRRLDARRSSGPTRCASPSRRSTSTPRRYRQLAEKHRPGSTATPCAPRCSTSSRPAARCRTRSPARAACSSAPSTRSGPTVPLGLRGRRPGRHARLALADAPRASPTASRAGTAAREQVPARRARRSSSAAASPRRCPTTSTRTSRSWSWTSAAPRRSSSGSWGSTPPAASRRPWPCSAAAGKSGSLSLAAARCAGAGRTIGVVPVERERALLEASGLADAVVLADARSPAGSVGCRRVRRRPGRRHGRLRRRARLRAAGDPRHRAGRHHHLLQHGDELRRRGARRRGPGRRRADARRQRLRARSRRDGAATSSARSRPCARSSRAGLAAETAGSDA